MNTQKIAKMNSSNLQFVIFIKFQAEVIENSTIHPGLLTFQTKWLFLTRDNYFQERNINLQHFASIIVKSGCVNQV